MKKLFQLQKLIAVTLIIMIVGIGSARAKEFESKLPICKGKEKIKWNNCNGIEIIDDELLEGKWVNGKKNGKMTVKNKITKKRLAL